MNKAILICAAAMLLAVSGLAQADVMQDGGDRLTALQNNDGGWDWPLNDGNPNNASPTNTVGPIAMGLITAYQNTGNAGHLAAINNASAFFMAKAEGDGSSADKGTFSPSDGYLAVALDQLLGVTTHVSHIQAEFYDKLAAGTYTHNGTDITTADYVNMIRTVRSGDYANMAAWDIGVGLYAANLAGAMTADWETGLKAEIDELDGGNYYDVLGLAGGVLGLAAIGEDFDPIAGEHVAAGSTADLATTLASYQIDAGGFAWNKDFVIALDGNETIQETAYALLALNEFDSAAFAGNIAGAGAYMESVQLGTGGWENFVGSTSGENNEITGEALWAIGTVPEPATLSLLVLAGTALLRRRR